MKRLLIVAGILLIPSLMLLGFEKFLDHKAPEISPVASAAHPIEVPSGPGSRFPFLETSPGGEVYLSWLEPEGKTYSLKMSRLLRNHWTTPQTISNGENWFVNWADFPSLNVGRGGLMAAHWLAYQAGGKYEYDVNVSISRDSGNSWSPAFVPHRDEVAAEHGFVSMVDWRDGFSMFWLDGRHTVETPRRPMTLRHAFLDRDGQLSHEIELDASVCDCCQTAAALTSDGPIVVYRDRSEQEIRDIKAIRFDGQEWSEPIDVGSDGWMIEGCPVNGPAVAADGQRVAVARFTQADDEPRVLLSFSDDGGKTFGPALRVDDREPYGRVDLLLDEDGFAWVSWLEAGTSEEEGVSVRLRRFDPTGAQGEPITVARSSGARSSGFPRMTHSGRDLIMAWTEPGEVSQIRTAWIR